MYLKFFALVISGHLNLQKFKHFSFLNRNFSAKKKKKGKLKCQEKHLKQITLTCC